MPSKQVVDVTPPNLNIHWRDRVFLPLKAAANIAGISPASLYRFEARGDLKFRRLGGRTLVETASLVRLLDSSEDWTASEAGSAARKARTERAAAEWQ